MTNIRHKVVLLTSAEFFTEHQWAATSCSLLDAFGVGFPQSRALGPILFDICANYVPFYC